MRSWKHHRRATATLAALGAAWAVLILTRANPWWAPLDACRVGDVYVQGDLEIPLQHARDASPEVWSRCENERRFTQGYGMEEGSNGTHLPGWCLDIATGEFRRGPQTLPALSDTDITRLVGALEDAGFAAPLRVVGYDLGYGRVVHPGDEHIHAVYQGQANFVACWRATRPGARASLERMLARR